MNYHTIYIDRLYALPRLRIYPIMAACIATTHVLFSSTPYVPKTLS
jgi:hypothetical protein